MLPVDWLAKSIVVWETRSFLRCYVEVECLVHPKIVGQLLSHPLSSPTLSNVCKPLSLIE